jgi:hypothetical protein
MRVRLQLLPPFATSKVLLPIPGSVKTISDLRKHIVRSLSTVSSVVEYARELVLEIEGFELLPGSDLGVIEAGDVISFVPSPCLLIEGGERCADDVQAEGRCE